MTLGQIIGLIVVIILGAWLFAKIMTRFVDWTLELSSRRAAAKIEIGSEWQSKNNDPWSEPIRATVIDKQDGWIRYQYEWSGTQWSARAMFWEDCWERAE